MSEKMVHNKIRKEIIRDNRKIKGKLQKQSLPFNLRFVEYLKNNQKKAAAFVVILAIMQYYKLFFCNLIIIKKDSYKYMRGIEPLNRKFNRWFLGVNNLVPPTIVEQKYIVNLAPESIIILEKLFYHLEQQFQYGVNRKFLYTVYDELQLFEKEEKDYPFIDNLATSRRYQTEYYFKREIKNCVLFIVNNLLTFSMRLCQKLKKKTPNISETEFLREFCLKALDKIDYIKEWERKVDQKRSEYKKLIPHLQDHKVRQLKLMLEKDPYISFEDIENKLQENGLMGMSIKDKIVINFQQLQLHQVLLDSYVQKLDRYVGSTKERRLREKVGLYQEKVNFYRERQTELNSSFNTLFPKQELFPTQ